ncbi:MAG: GntR family transcriptional regulator [Alphaproteobacteria bacterium]
MRSLSPQPGRTQQVYQMLLDAICDGTLAPSSHLVQEQLAARLGVSRQPVQQALAILKSEGLLLELGKRGLFVAPLDLETIRHHYEIRAALDALAARRAAEIVAANPAGRTDVAQEGLAILADGRAAIASSQVADMVSHDIAFHTFLYRRSGNPLLVTSAEPQWRQLRRVMGEVLRRAQSPADVWQQHEDILHAVLAGDAPRAEQTAIGHVASARRRLELALSPTHP